MKPGLLIIVKFALATLAISVFAATGMAQQTAPETTAPERVASTIVISGLGGSTEYDEQFKHYGDTIADHARQLTGDDADVVLLQGEAATREAILDTIGQLQQASVEDSIRIFLLGHGSFDGTQYKYNIPGPDLTGSELITALNQLPAAPQLVVLATSASGAVLEPLQAAHRVVITATKNGRERNAVKFTEYLVAGFGNSSADLDKDESISARELYKYAEKAVADHYDGEKLLASEHSRISGDSGETIELARYGSLLAQQNVISEELLGERKQISDQIASLRARKSDLSEDEYFDQLQSLMLELADVQRSIDEPVADGPAADGPAANDEPAAPARSILQELQEAPSLLPEEPVPTGNEANAANATPPTAPNTDEVTPVVE